MTTIALCGVGNIGRVHLGNLLSLRGCRVTGIFDASLQTLEQVSREFSVQPYAFWQNLLEEPGLDAVVIATPATSHRSLCHSALAAGKHVFVEKPLANTLEDSIVIVEASANALGQVVQVGFCERFNAAYLEAKRAVAQGRLGAVRAIQASRVAPYQYSDLTWELGVYDTASHNIDLILWLKGALPSSVLARGTQVYEETSIKHVSTTLLTFGDGSLAVDTIAWCQKDHHPLSDCSESQMFIRGSLDAFRVDQTSRPGWVMNGQQLKALDTVILGARNTTVV